MIGLLLYASTGFVVSARKETLVSSSTSTTSAGCPSVGGTHATVIVLLETNACTLIQRRGRRNALIIREAFVNSVCGQRLAYRLNLNIKIGPECPRKHVRRVACKLYLSGFCPMGSDCTHGQYVHFPTDDMIELNTPPQSKTRSTNGEGLPTTLSTLSPGARSTAPRVWAVH